MARIRTIKPAFFTSEDICKLQPLARLLFAGLWTEADKDGYLVDSPFQLRTRLLPADACDVDALLWDLAEARLIRRYTADTGRSYIQVLNFPEHQRPHPKEAASTIPPSGSARSRPVGLHGSQVNSPGDIPSTPVGREGDLGREGVLEGEPRRARSQGSGAHEPGSLPRDHMHHAICGPGWRICLKTWECGELMRQYGGAPEKQKAAVVSFVEVLEKSLGPDDSVGPFGWVEKHFQTWLHSINRAPVAPAKAVKRERTAAEILASIEGAP
jgi:hypothetical protein